MRTHYKLLLLFFLIATSTYAQNEPLPSLNIGDPAPPLRVGEWIKGTPVQKFEKGHVYVLEFWATWCKPCIAAMPHLSALAREYRDRVTVIGIDIYESKVRPVKSIKKVKAFVDSMGKRMDYVVAAEDSHFTVADWIGAAGEKNSGIPRTFVVNAEGRLAWVGHPKELDGVLRKIINNDWDINETVAKRNERKRLRELDKAANDTLYPYLVIPSKRDSAILVINEIVRNEPRLKYAPFVGSTTFTLLLERDPHKAYEFGKEVLVTPTYQDPPYHLIIGSIEWVSKKIKLPAEIYQLGAEAYQWQIDKYAESGNVAKNYNDMAEMYWRANNKAKAIDAMQKAIEALKNAKDFSRKEMAVFESRLQQYKNL